MFHGKEDASSVWYYCRPAMEELVDILQAGEISVALDAQRPDVKVVFKLDLVPQADGKGKASAHMHMGFSAAHGCWRCELPKKKFLETSERSMKQYGGDKMRTIESIKLNAHLTVTDCCEGCGMKVTATRAEMDALNAGITRPAKWKAIVVCTGDPLTDEPQPWISKTVKGELWLWTARHKSIYYGALGHQLMFPGKIIVLKLLVLALVVFGVLCCVQCIMYTCSLAKGYSPPSGPPALCTCARGLLL